MRSPAFWALALMMFPSAVFAAPYKDVYFQGTSPAFNSDGTLEFDGVRAIGSGITLNDALSFKYAFDLKSLDFVLTSKTLYQDVGVFNGFLMAINVSPAQPVAVDGSTVYQPGFTYNFLASKASPIIWKYTLKPGDVLSWEVDKPSAEYSLSFSGGSLNYTETVAAGQSIITGAHPILKAGTYSLRIAPTGSGVFAFSLRGWNANNRKLLQLGNGGFISAAFADDVRDYAKYAVTLKAGQVLRLPAGSSEIRMELLSNLGEPVYSGNGLALVYQAPTAGTYYLFIYNENGYGGSYSGTASITNAVAKPSALALADSTLPSRPMGATPARPRGGVR